MSEGLPEKLDKLEIAPKTILPLEHQKDCDLSVSENPFYNSCDENTTFPTWQNISSKSGEPYPTHAFLNGSERRNKSRIRRRSDSIVDTIKASMSDSTNGVRKQSMKKFGRNRNALLREPLLQALHLNSTRPVPVHCEFESNERMRTNHAAANARGIANLKDLIDECQSLLHENNTTDDQHPCKCKLSKRNSTNQPSCHYIVSRGESDIDYNTTKSAALDSPGTSSSSPTSSTSALNNRLNQQTSCSQQAGNGMPNDDVTIDELASYFDTFVYIPKKMSSMAEMMYI